MEGILTRERLGQDDLEAFARGLWCYHTRHIDVYVLNSVWGLQVCSVTYNLVRRKKEPMFELEIDTAFNMRSLWFCSNSELMQVP